MVNSISSQNDYKQYNPYQAGAIGIAAGCIGWEVEPYIKKGLMYPVGKYLHKQIPKCYGGGYKNYVDIALKQNQLENKLKIIDLNEQNAAQVKKSLLIMLHQEPKGFSKLLCRILRISTNKSNSSFERTLKGRNAFFSPKDNAVVCNFEKFGTPVFHEIQHKLNSISSNIFIRTLSKIRNPLAVFAPLGISAVAMFTKQKPQDEKQSLNDKIKNHCGILTALSILPLTIEECIANIKGNNIAKKAGVSGDMLKKVKHAHKLSIISYCTLPIVSGLAIWGAKTMRDKICSHEINQ